MSNLRRQKKERAERLASLNDEQLTELQRRREHSRLMRSGNLVYRHLLAAYEAGRRERLATAQWLAAVHAESNKSR